MKVGNDGDYRHVADSNQPSPEDARTTVDAAVLTPSPGGELTVQQTGTAPGSSGGRSTTSAFSGAMGTGGLKDVTESSVKTQNLLDDKLILSASRVEVNGRTVPVLGGIHLLAKLGQGGMGAVYYGLHPRLHQEVAVKVLPFHLAEQQPGLVQRFIREAQIAAKVRSPHLVGVIDVNEENGLFFLVMEFVSGKSAGEYLRGVILSGAKGLPEKTALTVCIGAAEGLASAHAHGVIHRDIKPDNIMIPRAGVGSGAAIPPTVANATDNPGTSAAPDAAAFDFTAAKLADLGLARNETGDQSMTAANVCMGTPGFMSPEQANDAKHASKPADVFSLGATLYALLAGDSPFKGSSLMQTLNFTVNEPHAPILGARPDVSAGTAALLDHCLAKKAEDRYPDAHAILNALRECRDALESPDEALNTMVYSTPPLTGTAKARTGMTENPTKRPTTIAENAFETAPPHFEKRAGWGPIVAGILVIVLGAGGVGGYFLWQKMDQDEREAQLQRERALTEKEAARQRAEDDMRQTAYQEELRMIQDWSKGQHSADSRRRETIRESVLSAVTAGLEFKREKNWDKAIQTVEDAVKNAGPLPLPLPSRIAADAFLKEAREERTRALEAFSTSLITAQNAKRDLNWDKTIQTLEDAFKALGAQPHESRTAAELLLNQAKDTQRISRDGFGGSYKTAQNYKKDQNWEKVIQILDDGFKSLGTLPHADRAAAETLLKDARDERERLKRKETMVLEALPAALIAAQEYKRTRNWDGVMMALEEPLKAIGSQAHPNRLTIEALLKEAKDQKERQRMFKIELEKGNESVKKENFEAAKLVFDNAKKWAQDPAEIAAVNDGFKRCTEGFRKNRLAQGLIFMTQGRGFRPDLRTDKKFPRGDWNKAADAFKNAAAIFTEIDEKDDLARANMETADCLRKDNNKDGDWSQAAGLYGSAQLLYGGLGDKKNQADAMSKHAACVDPALNPAGDLRQAAQLYGRAATLFGDAGSKRAHADNLSRQATCISKEKMMLGSSLRAADVFKSAALIYEEIGEKKAQGLCIFNQAACMIKEKKQNMTPEARTLFQRAIKISREAGDDATVKLAEDLLK